MTARTFPDDPDHLRDWPIGEVREAVWLAHGHPLPDGWRFADTERSHHDRYSRLIERVAP